MPNAFKFGVTYVFLQLALLGSSFGQTAESIFSATGIRDGLCVHLGSGDGKLTTSLIADGRMLVSALAVNNDELNNTRKEILQKGLMGLVSVEKPLATERLPYANGMVNLFVSDLDALPAGAKPNETEILRIVSAYGAAYIKTGGSWKTIHKKMLSHHDEWSHRSHSYDGNPLSQDKGVAPPMTRLKWMSGRRYGMNFDGFAIAENTVVSRDQDKGDSYIYSARDAGNGMPLWTKRSGKADHFTTPVIAEGRAFFSLGEKMPLKSYEIRTGKELQTYTDGGLFTGANLVYKNTRAHVIVYDGIVYIPNEKLLTALDVKTGQKLWQHKVNNWVSFPVIDKKRNQIIFGETLTNHQMGRWDGAPLEAVTGLNCKTGAPIWRNTAFLGAGGGQKKQPNMTQLAVDNDRVYALGSFGIGSPNGDPFLGAIDISTNKLLWVSHFQIQPLKYASSDRNIYWGLEQLANVAGGEKKTYGHTMVIRNGIPLLGVGETYVVIDPQTGKPKEEVRTGKWENCNRFHATQDYVVTGAITMRPFAGEDITRSMISRSACAGGAFPAYGNLYLGTGWCTCYNSLRGVLSLTSTKEEPFQNPIEDSKRIVKGEVGSVNSKAEAFAYDNKNSEIIDIWTLAFEYDNRTSKGQGKLVTGTLNASGKSFTGNVHGQYIEAKDGSGNLIWTFLASGRINQAPVLVDGSLFFGARDGWVYSLNPDNGALNWKFLAAPNEEKVGVHGQIESRWPVTGVGADNGRITCAAGTHSEADGGIYVWSLDTKTGMPKSRVVLYSPPMKYKIGMKPNDMEPSSTMRTATIINNGISGAKIVNVGFDRGAFRSQGNGFIPSKNEFSVDFSKFNGKSIDPRTGDFSPSSIEDKKQRLGFGTSLNLQLRLVSGYVYVTVTDGADLIVSDPAGRTVFEASKVKESVRIPQHIRHGNYIITAKQGNKQQSHTFTLP